MNNKILGCLLGGAAGDALGVPVEFDKLSEIKNKYGSNGITFETFQGKPLASDDTQMTLFTANGLLMNGDILKNVWASYQDWLETQVRQTKSDMSHEPVTWLVDYPEMFASREPGRTCLQMLIHNTPGSLEHPYNQSKGCGGVMRVAPVGLLYKKFNDEQTLKYGAQIAALTHGHPMSSLASAFMAELICKIMIEDKSLKDCIKLTGYEFSKSFSIYPEATEFLDIVGQAVKLAELDMSDLEAINTLGQGWVAEETLAIAIYCSLKHETDFVKAVETAVNHDGDSDSTGALTGQILGAKYGTKILPKDFTAKIDLNHVIQIMAKKINEKNNTY